MIFTQAIHALCCQPCFPYIGELATPYLTNDCGKQNFRFCHRADYSGCQPTGCAEGVAASDSDSDSGYQSAPEWPASPAPTSLRPNEASLAAPHDASARAACTSTGASKDCLHLLSRSPAWQTVLVCSDVAIINRVKVVLAITSLQTVTAVAPVQAFSVYLEELCATSTGPAGLCS